MLYPSLTPLTKINSTWIKILKIRPTTIKLEENTGSSSLVSVGNDLLDTIPKAQTTKAKISKWDYIQLKASAQQKKQGTK